MGTQVSPQWHALSPPGAAWGMAGAWLSRRWHGDGGWRMEGLPQGGHGARHGRLEARLVAVHAGRDPCPPPWVTLGKLGVAPAPPKRQLAGALVPLICRASVSPAESEGWGCMDAGEGSGVGTGSAHPGHLLLWGGGKWGVDVWMMRARGCRWYGHGRGGQKAACNRSAWGCKEHVGAWAPVGADGDVGVPSRAALSVGGRRGAFAPPRAASGGRARRVPCAGGCVAGGGEPAASGQT